MVACMAGVVPLAREISSPVRDTSASLGASLLNFSVEINF